MWLQPRAESFFFFSNQCLEVKQEHLFIQPNCDSQIQSILGRELMATRFFVFCLFFNFKDWITNSHPQERETLNRFGGVEKSLELAGRIVLTGHCGDLWGLSVSQLSFRITFVDVRKERHRHIGIRGNTDENCLLAAARVLHPESALSPPRSRLATHPHTHPLPYIRNIFQGDCVHSADQQQTTSKTLFSSSCPPYSPVLIIYCNQLTTIRIHNYTLIHFIPSTHPWFIPTSKFVPTQLLPFELTHFVFQINLDFLIAN